MRDQQDKPDARVHKDARARVRIVKQLRGEMPFDSFTLVGGPYDSCAIGGPSYIKFKVGEQLILMLDGPVPENTRVIVPWWVNRLRMRTETEIRRIIARLDVAWRKRLALVRDVFPEPEEDDYAALLLAAERARNPSAPLHHPPEPPPDPEDFTPRPKRINHKYFTRSRGKAVLPEDLANAIEFRRANSPEEVIAVHRRLLERWVVKELLQPEERARRFAAAVTDESLLKADFPVRDLKLPEDADSELAGVLTLLNLADDEPESLAWSYARKGHGEVLAPWLAGHTEDAPTSWDALKLYFDSAHPSAIPVVLRALRAERNLLRLDNYLEYLLVVGSREGVDEVVRRAAERPKRIKDLLEVAEKAVPRDQALIDRLVALRDGR